MEIGPLCIEPENELHLLGFTNTYMYFDSVCFHYLND